MADTFLLHHLSDVHVGPLHYRADRKLRFVPAYHEGVAQMKRYLSHLDSRQAIALPDVVVISGDLTSYATQEEMNAAKDWIRSLVMVLRKKSPRWRSGKQENAPRVLMVPGNHDLDWSQPDYARKIERYARMADDLASYGVLSAVYHFDPAPPTTWDFGDEANVFVNLMNSTTLGGVKDPKLELLLEQLKVDYEAVLQKKGDALADAVYALEQHVRQDPGYVRPDALDGLAASLRGVPDTRVKIAVMHHNLSSVPADDIETYDTIINAGKVKTRLMGHGFDLVLHGHRHFPFITHERAPSVGKGALLVVGADSLGSKESASFLEFRIHNVTHAHQAETADCHVTVVDYQFKLGADTYEGNVLFEQCVDRCTRERFDRIFKGLGAPSLTSLDRKRELTEAIDKVVHQLNRVRSDLSDWNEDGSRWVDEFCKGLGSYFQIWATDLQDRSVDVSQFYGAYLYTQLGERLRRLLENPSKTWVFSPLVFDAIQRTGWRPDAAIWGQVDVVPGEPPLAGQLEIVRILLRDRRGRNDTSELKSMERLHALLGVPLFLLDLEGTWPDERRDFIVGTEGTGRVRAFEYEPTGGRVVKATGLRVQHLRSRFEQLLEHAALRTIPEALTNDTMLPRREMSTFAARYAEERSASEGLLQRLVRLVQPDGGGAGLDVGCGTGNYTFPFVGQFQELWGLDSSAEMISQASRMMGVRSGDEGARVEWRIADARATGLPSESFDRIWSVSTLHYMKGEEHRIFFSEMHRLLRPGGRMVIDTEFLEQHASLWQAHFFPSLVTRYRDALPSQRDLRGYLREIGFEAIEFETAEIDPDDAKGVTRIGQKAPHLYLDHGVVQLIPAFARMSSSEYADGARRLRQAIADESIVQIMQEHEGRAEVPGDYGFIVAIKRKRSSRPARPSRPVAS